MSGGIMVTDLENFPGAEFVLPGLRDLQAGKSRTIGALLVAIAATRLAEAGLDVARENLAYEPELLLYACLEDDREDAYQYYNALLKRLDSFCNALENIL
jgi:hypothetical protein